MKRFFLVALLCLLPGSLLAQATGVTGAAFRIGRPATHSSIGDTADVLRAEFRDTTIVIVQDSAAALRGEMPDSAAEVVEDSLVVIRTGLDSVRTAAANVVEDSLVEIRAGLDSIPTLAADIVEDSLVEVRALTTALSNGVDTANTAAANVIGDSLVLYIPILTPTIADSTFKGRTFTARAGEALTFGDLVYWKLDSLWLARGDTVGANDLLPAVAVCVAKAGISGGAEGLFGELLGFIRADGWTHFNRDSVLYVDTTAGGQFSMYAPSVAGMISQPVGVARDSNLVQLFPSINLTTK